MFPEFLAILAFAMMSGLCLIAAVIALLFAMDAKIDVKALQNSTHSVIMKPIDPYSDVDDEMLEESLKQTTGIIEKSEDDYLGLSDEEM